MVNTWSRCPTLPYTAIQPFIGIIWGISKRLWLNETIQLVQVQRAKVSLEKCQVQSKHIHAKFEINILINYYTRPCQWPKTNIAHRIWQGANIDKYRTFRTKMSSLSFMAQYKKKIAYFCQELHFDGTRRGFQTYLCVQSNKALNIVAL